MPLSLGTTG